MKKLMIDCGTVHANHESIAQALRAAADAIDANQGTLAINTSQTRDKDGNDIVKTKATFTPAAPAA